MFSRNTGKVQFSDAPGTREFASLAFDLHLAIHYSPSKIGKYKRVLYEQVTGVKVCFFAFSFIGLLLLLLLLVSLLSTGFVFALWMSCLGASSVPVGVREESRCCHFSVGLRRPKRARSHRNAVCRNG
jgi:hypothetical protein